MKYPYYIVPQVEEYRKLDPGSEEAKKLGRFLSANIGDYASLRLLLGIDPPEFARFYPDMETANPTTLDTIDAFLDKFGKDYPDTLTLESATSGYVLEDDSPEDLDKEEAQEDISRQAFPQKEETVEIEDKEDPEVETKFPDENMLSFYIKGKRYAEAIEFIEGQNLNNPEKSIYFAHQIRFLKKLRAVENYKTNPKADKISQNK